jgi:queuine tRNA-ribosyltransferase
MTGLSFRLIATDGAARRGEIMTAAWAVADAGFMPVGTQATVKALAAGTVRATAPTSCWQYLPPDAAAGAERVALGGCMSS